MARFIPKQFAENSTTSVVFGSFQEQGGHVGDGTISSDPATLQGGTAWPLGWKAATDNFFQIPRGEEMEGLERVLSAAIIQQFKDGLTFWQPEMPVTQYQTIVQYQTGSDRPKLYINITGTSTSTPPDSDTTNWYMFLDTGTPYANVDLSNLSTAGQAVIDGKADVDLSNLTATGEAHFANPDMSNLSTAGKSAVVDLSAPDYTAGVDYVASWGSDITTTKSGWVFVVSNDSSPGNSVTFNIEGYSFRVMVNSNTSGVAGSCMFRVPANSTWSVTGGNGYFRQLYFFPCKGA